MPSLQAGAPEAPSGDEFLRVEEHGIEPLPRPERHGRSRELAFLWAGAFVNYASLLTASLLTDFFGLGVWDGLAAVVLGTVSAALILGLLSHTGPRSGLPQIAFTRRIFGRNGARIGALLTLILAVGWFALDSVIVSIAVAVYGHATIRAFETWGAIAFALLSVVLFAALAPQFRWGTGPSVRGPDFPAAFVLGFMVSFALVASWFPFASDYSRYLPQDTPPRGLTLWPVLGVSVPMIFLGLFGLLLPTIDPKLAAGEGGVLAG